MNPFVRRHARPAEVCTGFTPNGRCRKKGVNASGRCATCEEARAAGDFAVLDSYLPGLERKP